jgi:hypothetical protein
MKSSVEDVPADNCTPVSQLNKSKLTVEVTLGASGALGLDGGLLSGGVLLDVLLGPLEHASAPDLGLGLLVLTKDSGLLLELIAGLPPLEDRLRNKAAENIKKEMKRVKQRRGQDQERHHGREAKRSMRHEARKSQARREPATAEAFRLSETDAG